MTRKTSVTRVPFSERGDLLHWVSPTTGQDYGHTTDWRDNEPFTAAMTVGQMYAGRSAKYVDLVDEAGHRYPMFVTDLLDVLATEHGLQGNRTGEQTWMVGKRGQNYGLKLADPAPRARS